MFETLRRKGAHIRLQVFLVFLLLPGSLPQGRIAALVVRQSPAGSATPLKKSSTTAQAEELRLQALTLVRKATREDLTRAIEKLHQSAHLFINARHSEAAAADYLSLGEIYFTRSQYQRALGMYRLAILLNGNSSQDLKCAALSHIAITYVTTGDLQNSQEYANQAMECSGHSSSPLVRAQAIEAQGLRLMYAQDTTAARSLFRSAADLLKDTREADTLAGLSLYQGIAALQTGDTKGALEEESEALRLWQSSGNIQGVARAQAALGLLWVLLGEPDQAGASYKSALLTFRALGDLDNEAVTLNGLGVLSEAIGNHEDSFRYFDKARKIFVQLRDHVGEPAAMDGAAKAQWKMGHFAQAQRLYETKLHLAQKAGNFRMEASSWSNLADSYALTHHPEKAEPLYLRSLALCRSAHHVLGELEALIHLGHFYSEQGDYARALSFLQSALRPAEETGEVAKLAQIQFEMAAVHQKTGDLKSARLEIEKTLLIIENQRLKVSDFESRAAYFSSVHSYYQLYITILMDLHKLHPEAGHARQAFEAAEKSKVRSLLDLLASSSGAGCLPAPAEPATPIPVVPAEGDATGPPPAGCASRAPAVLTLDEVQSEIRGDDSILLEYALGRQHSYLWAVDESGMTSYELAGSGQIARLTTQLLGSLTARQRTQGRAPLEISRMIRRADREYMQHSTALAAVLLAPAAGRLAKKRVIIVPDGLLQYVPFSALPVPVAAGNHSHARPSISVDLVNLPSASTLHAIRSAAATHALPTSMAVIFADPVFGLDDPRFRSRGARHQRHAETPETLRLALRDVGLGSSNSGSANIPRLPESRNEARSIAKSMAGGKVRLIMGFDANRDAVIKGNLGNYRFIHFATHGLLDTAHPDSSGLVLSLVNEKGKPQDGYLRIKDIYQLKLSADLVVLSACDSALGRDLSSEGVIGLTRAFLFAGSRGVVATLWKVDDAATSELMKHFYERLHGGETPAAALRGAQSDLAAIPKWESPYFWAAFILQGDYR